MTATTDGNGAREAGLTLAAIASALAIPGVPVLLVLAFVAEHVASFHGTCGPYPTDIPAYPCGFAEYLANFANPFALAGLFALSTAAAVATTAALAIGWLIAGGAMLLARARRGGLSPSAR